MGSALINLTAVIDTFGGTKAGPLQFTAQVMRGGEPAVRITGAQATLPAPLTTYWTGTAWAPQQPALVDVPLDCYWRVELTNQTARRVANVILPTGHGSAVDFAALTVVDPATLQPTPSQLDTWLRSVVPLPPTGTAAGTVPTVQADGSVAYQPQTGGGGGGSAAFEYFQSTAAATWTIPHSFGRRPIVEVFTLAGDLVFTDVAASTSQVVITFPSPSTGYAVLT